MNLVCDLDGVVYRGEELIPGSELALQAAADAGLDIWFATNNSTKSPIEVQGKIQRITGYLPQESRIVTSSQAAASMLTAEEGPVYVFGSAAIDEALRDAGVETTSESTEARSVVVGMDRALTYQRLADAAAAVRRGARFIATNDDPTFPVEDGFEPGSGSMVAAVTVASGRSPEIAGKPHPPMKDLLVARGVGPGAWVVGDRLDTDIALAAGSSEWRSIVVLTGVTTEEDDREAADFVTADLASAVDLVLDHQTRR